MPQHTTHDKQAPRPGRALAALSVLLTSLSILLAAPTQTTAWRHHTTTWTPTVTAAYEELAGASEDHAPRHYNFLTKQIIYRSEDPQLLLEMLLEEATPIGKFYAMKGLGVVAPERFERAARELEASDATVMGRSGCKVREEQLSSWVAQVRELPSSRSSSLRAEMLLPH